MQLIKPSTHDGRHMPMHLFEIFLHSFINRTTDYNLAITERESGQDRTGQDRTGRDRMAEYGSSLLSNGTRYDKNYKPN